MVEGRKDRPCAIVIALDAAGNPPHKRVSVVPITHSPQNPAAAIEIPPRVKQHLGLDDERSWVVLDEMNVFTWPGYDLRPIRRGETRVDFGFLPPRFFNELVEKLNQLIEAGKAEQTSRDE